MSRVVATPALVTPAILLGQVPYGEADRVVTLYTRTHGKVSAMARAARKSRRRFGASLALFVVGEATLRERRGAELMTLERFDALLDFSALGGDLVRLAHASYATELVHRLTVPRHADAALFELLVEAYRAIAAAPPSADLLRAFELRLMGELGLRPVLCRCVGCGVEHEAVLDEPGAVVDPARGGLVCARCVGRGVPLPGAARRRLLEVQELPLAGAAALPPAPAETAASARAVMHAIVGAHVSGPLRSLEFIQKLRQS